MEEPPSLYEAVEEARKVTESYRGLLALADSVAKRLAQELDGVKVIGRVSMLEKVGGDEIPIDVPPHVWVKLSQKWPQLLSSSYYLALVDPKTLSLLVVVVEETQVASALAGIRSGEQPSYLGTVAEGSPLQAASYHMVSLRIVARPVLAVHLGLEGAGKLIDAEDPFRVLESMPATSPMVPPDPDSPVFVPKPKLLETLLLADRGEGVAIGALAVLDTVYMAGGDVVPVRLSWRTLVKHMLVTGTTGSGKTSFVKNLVYNAVRTRKARALILDANGDYIAAALPGYVPSELLDESRRLLVKRVYDVEPAKDGALMGPRLNPLIVVPYFSGLTLEQQCKAYARRLGGLIHAMYSRLGCETMVKLERPLSDEKACIYAVEVKGCRETLPDTRIRLPVVFRSIVVGGDASRIAQVDPMLTERAREEIRRMHRFCVEERRWRVNSVRDLYDCISRYSGELRGRGFHRETVNHVLRRLYALAATGIVDSGAPDLDYGELARLRDTMEKRVDHVQRDSIILDMEYAVARAPRESDPKAIKLLLVARMVQSLIRHAEEEDRRERYTVVVVDEAHLFFGSKTEEYTAAMVSWLERLARLGRARGIALILSTHREEDVSPVVQSLCNTRVYFRLDERAAEKAMIPAHYRRRLPFFADHAAVLASYAVRGGYVTIASAPAIVGHRTA